MLLASLWHSSADARTARLAPPVARPDCLPGLGMRTGRGCSCFRRQTALAIVEFAFFFRRSGMARVIPLSRIATFTRLQVQPCLGPRLADGDGVCMHTAPPSLTGGQLPGHPVRVVGKCTPSVLARCLTVGAFCIFIGRFPTYSAATRLAGLS